MEQTITYDGGQTLAYAEYGDRDGFPILIQHGLIASIQDVELFEQLVQLKTRLICIARPGYGRSTPCTMASFAEWPRIVAALIHRLAIGEFDILAMSSGAPYGYALGYGLPDQVRRIFVFSGTPALYDDVVRSAWPYPLTRDATMADLEKLAQTLFFSNLSSDDLSKNDIRDSMMNNCFGVAQDLRLRALNWGFTLPQVKAQIIMRHSKTDEAMPCSTAVRTSELLANCRLELVESGPHFSSEALDDFIKSQMSRYFESRIAS